MVLLSWSAAFCAAEKMPEKNPLALVDWDIVPPGVLTSSKVGVRGAGIDWDSLLDCEPEFARRCLILSTEESFCTRGEMGEDVIADLLGNVGALNEGSVGVGGVTKVVGVSTRFGGVSGRAFVFTLEKSPFVTTAERS